MKPRVYMVGVTEEEWRSVGCETTLRTLSELGMSLERRIAAQVRIAADRDLYDRTCRALEEGALQVCAENIGSRQILQDAKAAAYVALTSRLAGWTQAEVDSFTGFLQGSDAAAAKKYRVQRPEPIGKSFYPPGWTVLQQWAVYSAITDQYAAVLRARFLQGESAEAHDLAAAAQIKASFCKRLAPDATLIESVTLEPY